MKRFVFWDSSPKTFDIIFFRITYGISKTVSIFSGHTILNTHTYNILYSLSLCFSGMPILCSVVMSSDSGCNAYRRGQRWTLANIIYEWYLYMHFLEHFCQRPRQCLYTSTADTMTSPVHSCILRILYASTFEILTIYTRLRGDRLKQ